MGSGNSNRRENMDDRESEETGGSDLRRSPRLSGRSGESEGNSDPDLATVLSYLIRSGQVRFISSGMDDDDEDEDYYDEDEECVRPDRPPQPDPSPDTSKLENSEIRHQILHDTGSINTPQKGAKKRALSRMLMKREVGVCGNGNFSRGDRCGINSIYLPNKCDVVARYHHKAFCGIYSQEGDIFLSACQDRVLRIYDTKKGEFKLIKSLHARDVGWSVVDTAFSPDGNYLIYSSWSDSIHICSIYGDHETHNVLPLFPNNHHSFCVFSLAFSEDNKEIMGGANDGHLYVYDRERNERTLRIDGHEDDVNAVAFADYNSNILCSGADDGLVKVWDRRTLDDTNAEPVGVLAGHCDGITYIDTRGDGRYLLSNSKDQTIKLWDLRKFSTAQAQEATRREVSKQNWDYRWQQVPRKVVKKSKTIPGDSSLMTYRGHCVLNTLVRARFSPRFSTGQRYIYSGCATGAVIVYDVLTGEIVTKMEGTHRQCVRDVSWHPYENTLMSTSWDGTVGRWSYAYDQTLDSPEVSDEEDDNDCPRGKKLQKKVKCRTSGFRLRTAFVD